ncbi:MAG: EAL domain-containing protein [Congregibacter sp.]|nr:EAL domain-containing protein [Congregibacter sp.]
MIPASLAGRLLALLVGLLGAALLASTVASLRAANANVTALVTDELEVRDRITRFALAQGAESLKERVDVVTADFAFKAAVASSDRGTVLSALANHGERLNADLAMLLDSNGAIKLTSADLPEVPVSILNRVSATASGSSTLLEVLGGRPYQVVVSPVLAPALIGWLVIGDELDEQMLSELAQLSNADISLIISGQTSTMPRLVSTLDFASEIAQLDVAAASRDLSERGWLSRPMALTSSAPTDAAQVSLLLSLSLDEALADYKPLRLQLVVIAVIALVLAILLALAASRWITRPVTAMVTAAKRIANGEYSYKLELDSGTELDTLAQALSVMQDTVAERESRIQHQAQHDLLTQLPNRNYLYTLYQRYLLENPARATFGIALMELENIGQVRDLYGSAFSDRVLQSAAQRVTQSLRRGDMAGRVGDQQILLFLQEISVEELGPVLEKIQEQSSQPLIVDGVPVRPELRLGFAFSPAHGMDFDDLQRRAQLALTWARTHGQTHATYALGQDESHLRQIRIANRLQEAVKENAFHLLYQPKFCIQTRRVNSAEALIRWEDKELGRVFPDEFITIAEQTGIISKLSEWVVARVIADQQRLQKDAVDLAVSINLSGIDIVQDGFVDRILMDVQDAGLPIDAVVLEVTETAMMADPDAAKRNMKRVEKLGMRISIDDYGTGFSSLAQLRSLPVRELKLDRSLIENIDKELGDRLIVRSTIDMAHHLGLEVVAEGVETAAILALLRDMGCDVIQGYLLAKPISFDALGEFVKQEGLNIAHITRILDEHASE